MMPVHLFISSFKIEDVYEVDNKKSVFNNGHIGIVFGKFRRITISFSR